MLGNVILTVIVVLLFSILFVFIKLFQMISDLKDILEDIREQDRRFYEKEIEKESNYDNLVYQSMPTLEERPNPYLDPTTGLYNYQYFKKHNIKEEDI